MLLIAILVSLLLISLGVGLYLQVGINQNDIIEDRKRNDGERD